MANAKARIDWYRSPIDRTILADLTKKSDFRPLLQNLGLLLVSGATGTLAFWAFHNLTWPWVLLTVYLHCSFYGFFGGGAGGHELSHKNMFKTKALNEFFIRLNGFLTWFNFVYFRHSHAGHHQYTVHDDLDLEVMLPIKLRPQAWLWAFTVNLPAAKRVFSMFARHAFGRRRETILTSEWEKRIFPPGDREGLRSLQRWARTVVFGHLALATLFVATGNWILLFLVTFAPFIATWFVMLTHMPQHVGMQPDVPDWRRSTRTYLAGPIVRFFYWNMNYHVEHHMFAAVPFYNLPKLRKAIESDLPIASRGLAATWREILDTVRRQRQDPTYYHRPEFPQTARGTEPDTEPDTEPRPGATG
jgi:fatty acid desaturase